MKPPFPPPVPALDQDCSIPWWAVCSPGPQQRCVVTPGWPWEGGRDLEVTASLPGKGGGSSSFSLLNPCLSPSLSVSFSLSLSPTVKYLLY